MRPSANRHKLARLRQTLNLGQKELASILGWPFDTYQKIELGKHRLTPTRALKVQEETGVSAAYLLAKDVNAEMLDCSGKPFTEATYEKVRTEIKRPKVGLSDRWNLNSSMANVVAQILAIVLAAMKKNRSDPCLFDLVELLKKFRESYPMEGKYYARVLGSLVFHNGKLNEAMREAVTLFEQEARDHSFRESQKLASTMDKEHAKASLCAFGKRASPENRGGRRSHGRQCERSAGVGGEGGIVPG